MRIVLALLLLLIGMEPAMAYGQPVANLGMGGDREASPTKRVLVENSRDYSDASLKPAAPTDEDLLQYLLMIMRGPGYVDYAGMMPAPREGAPILPPAPPLTKTAPKLQRNPWDF